MPVLASFSALGVFGLCLLTGGCMVNGLNRWPRPGFGNAVVYLCRVLYEFQRSRGMSRLATSGILYVFSHMCMIMLCSQKLTLINKSERFSTGTFNCWKRAAVDPASE